MAGRTLQELLAAAVLRVEQFRGTLADLSRSQVDSPGMAASGRMVRSGPNIGSSMTTSTPYTPMGSTVLDPTKPMTMISRYGGFGVSNAGWSMISATNLRNIRSYHWSDGRVFFVTYNAGGVAVKYLTLGVGTGFADNQQHLWSVRFDPTALIYAWRKDRINQTVTLNSTGAAVFDPTQDMQWGSGVPGTYMRMTCLWYWQEYLSDDEVSLLEDAADRLVTPQSMITRTFPSRFAIPGESGVAAHWLFRPDELAQGRYLDHSGNGVDLTVIEGSPTTGPDGGIRCPPGSTSNKWRRTAIVVADDFAYSCDLTLDSATALANDMFFQNTNVGHRLQSMAGSGWLGLSLDSGVTYAQSAFSVVGKGRVRATCLYDGSNQILTINGREVGNTPVVPVIPAGNLRVGASAATVHRLKITAKRLTVAEARVEYVREFAREIIQAWTPGEEGETNVSGLTTNTQIGDIFVPSGASNLKFVWLRNISQLALEDSSASSNYRIVFRRVDRPMYGTYRIKFRIRANNVNNYLRFGVQPDRSSTIYTASLGSYWVNYGWDGTKTVIALYTGNTAIIAPVTVQTPNNETDHEIIFARHPSGMWYLYLDNQFIGSASNSTYNLNGGYFTVYPGACQVYNVTEFQGEMEPQEIK